MQFEIQTRVVPGVFHRIPIQGVGTYTFLSNSVIEPTDDLWVGSFKEVEDLDTLFTIGLVGKGGYADSVQVASGYLFHSNMPVSNYGTSIMAYSNAARMSRRFEIKPEDVVTTFRNSHFYVYSVKSVSTLVTCADLSEELNSFLTMI